MFAIDRKPDTACVRCGQLFAAPSFTKDGSPMYGLCQWCNDQDASMSEMFKNEEDTDNEIGYMGTSGTEMSDHDY